MTKRTMHIYRPDGSTEHRETDLPAEPPYKVLRDLICPLLDGADLEHVAVLFEGCRADMFVDEMGLMKRLSRNNAATDVYRAAALRRQPSADPESLPFIAGPAVLFDQPVWF